MPAVSVTICIGRGGGGIGGLNFPCNVMPNIVRPSFQDTAPGHEVETVSRNMLSRTSTKIHEKRGEGLTASGRSIPGLSIGRK